MQHISIHILVMGEGGMVAREAWWQREAWWLSGSVPDCCPAVPVSPQPTAT
jgi:hypothetical protein